MFIISVPWQKDEVADLATEGRRRAAYGPQLCPLLTSCLAARSFAPFALYSVHTAACSAPTFPSVLQTRFPTTWLLRGCASCTLRWVGRGTGAWASPGSGGGREGRLTANHHNAVHNVLSPRHYIVYFQWGLAHPSQTFIAPLFCCLKPKHCRKILNCLIAVL